MPNQLNTIRLVRSEQGTMVLMALILTALVSMMVFSIMSWHSNLEAIKLNQRIKFTAEGILQNVVVQVYNNEAWKATAGGDTCMLSGVGCAIGAGGPLILRYPDQSIMVDSTNPIDGFNLFGKRCSAEVSGGFNQNGNDLCPFKYQLRWTTVNCTAVKCDVRITGDFFYAPASQRLQIPLSTQKYKIDLIRGKEADSLQAACHSLGGTFNQGSLTCSAPPEAPPCPMGQVLKVVVQGLPPVCESAIVSSTPCPIGTAATGIAPTGVFVCAAL